MDRFKHCHNCDVECSNWFRCCRNSCMDRFRYYYMYKFILPDSNTVMDRLKYCYSCCTAAGMIKILLWLLCELFIYNYITAEIQILLNITLLCYLNSYRYHNCLWTDSNPLLLQPLYELIQIQLLTGVHCLLTESNTTSLLLYKLIQTPL